MTWVTFGGLFHLFLAVVEDRVKNHWSSEKKGCTILRSWEFPWSQSILLGRVSAGASHPPLTAVYMSEQVTDQLGFGQLLRSFCSNQGEKCQWSELEMEINE